MFRVVFLLILFAAPYLVVGADGGSSKAQSVPSKPGPAAQERQFADSIAKAIVEKRHDFIGQRLSPQLIKAYGKEANLRGLTAIEAAYGDIQKFEFKNTTKGTRDIANKPLPFVIHWYAVATSQYPKDRYMKVEVSTEAGRYYLAGYEVLQFMGAAPPFLK